MEGEKNLVGFGPRNGLCLKIMFLEEQSATATEIPIAMDGGSKGERGDNVEG